MKKHSLLITFIILFVWVLTLSVILYERQPKYIEFPKISTEQTQTATDEQLKLIRAEMQVMRDYNDDFLSTVYWSLYTVLIVASLLIGANLFSGLRLADREREALRQELEGLLQRDIAALRQELQQNDFQQVMQLSTKIVTVDFEVKRLRQELVWFKRDILAFKGEQRLNQSDNAGALAEYSKILQIEIDEDNRTFIPDILNTIRIVLERGMKPTIPVTRRILESLDQLPAGFALEAERIRELLRTE